MVKERHGPEFWILQSVNTMHLAFKTLYSQHLQDGAIENALDIPKILDDFGQDDDKTSIKDIFGIFGSAFGTAVTLAGVVGGKGGEAASTVYSLLDSIFSIVGTALPEPGELEEAELAEITKLYFLKSKELLEDTLTFWQDVKDIEADRICHETGVVLVSPDVLHQIQAAPPYLLHAFTKESIE
ncbi:hypothetical protein ACHAPT_012121 [Fusarium lateritium]